MQTGLRDVKHPEEFKPLPIPMFTVFQLKKKKSNSVRNSNPTRIFFPLSGTQEQVRAQSCQADTCNAFAATLNSSTFHQEVHLNFVSYSVPTLRSPAVLLPASPYPLRHCEDHSNIHSSPRRSCHLLAHAPRSAVRCRFPLEGGGGSIANCFSSSHF